MAEISRHMLREMREVFRKLCNDEDIDKHVQLIYNAGYKMGLKARSPIPDYPSDE